MKYKLITCLLGSLFAVSSNAGMLNKTNEQHDSLINTQPKTFVAHVSIYKQDMSHKNTLSKMNASGVYNDNSMLVKGFSNKDYKNILNSIVEGYDGSPLPYSNYKETPIVKSIVTDNDGKGNTITTVVPGAIDEGYSLYLNKLGNKVTVKIDDKVIEEIRKMKVEDKELSLPQIHEWSVSQQYLINDNKTIRVDSPSYTKYVNGKKQSFKHIYIIKLKEK